MLNNIGIIGGGTAGLVTALLLRARFPKLGITIVESDKIGIVGVGEGSTEHWKEFMLDCQLPLNDLIEKTDCTFKYGINFDNWNGDNKNYFHSVSGGFNMESSTNSKIIYAYLVANGADPKQLMPPYIEKSRHSEPYWGVNQFHFNTFMLNEYLHEICESKNIVIKKAEIDKVTLDQDGGIDKLTSTTGEEIQFDFYCDSTGFHRLLMEKALGVKWKSYSEYLPVNSAIAFPTEREEDIPSWTWSRAMNAGWLWRIPTQNRFGNGYVFSDKHITFEDAKKEVEELYGYKIDVAKEIKFDAGRLEKFWHKNCAAIGLSGSFVEPLEASSIGSSIIQAGFLASALPAYVPGNTYAEDMFNKESIELVENIVDYVALHYVTKRSDTEFWKDAKKLPKPKGLQNLLELYKHKFPGPGDFPNKKLMFKDANFIMVMHGLGLLDPKVAQKELDIQSDMVLESVPLNIKWEDDGPTLSHREALEFLKNSKQEF